MIRRLSDRFKPYQKRKGVEKFNTLFIDTSYFMNVNSPP